MPGFVGICSNRLPQSDEALKEAVHATIYSHKCSSNTLLSDNNFILEKSFFNFLEIDRMEAIVDGCVAYVNGEIYNQSNLTKDAGEVFADTLLRSYREDTLETLLPKVNGIFNAIIYDRNKKILLLITDRYGLKPIYYSHKNNCLSLAPEVKCFSFFRSFHLQIRKDVIDCFMQLEHFMGNETWLKDVEIAAPSTIYTYSFEQDSFTSRRYWSWSKIKIAKISLEEASERMGELLENAVKSCSESNSSIGIALSGGSDSRALLAAVHDKKPVTYTFGTPKSKDMKIASRVSKMAGVKHYSFDTYTSDWLTSRFSGVWKTDGMLNMYHMHYSHLMGEIAKIMDINLSGFLGDAVLGGSYLEKKGKTFLNKRIDNSIAQHYYGSHFERCSTKDSFFDLDKIDPYLFYNRGRRMIGMGAEEPYKTVPQRLPFMDIDLMDLSYSLPDEYRVHSKVYNKALLLKYPNFYVDIPHATSGVPISDHPSVLQQFLKKYNRLLWIAKYKLGFQTSYVNVHNWLKEPATAAFVSMILDPKNAIYPSYTGHNYLKEFVVPHLNGKQNYMKQIMGALTLEIWFQQILNKKFLTDPGES
jgi:asparagine synthetase B (glutamine-hydrolysing)